MTKLMSNNALSPCSYIASLPASQLLKDPIPASYLSANSYMYPSHRVAEWRTCDVGIATCTPHRVPEWRICDVGLGRDSEAPARKERGRRNGRCKLLHCLQDTHSALIYTLVYRNYLWCYIQVCWVIILYKHTTQCPFTDARLCWVSREKRKVLIQPQ